MPGEVTDAGVERAVVELLQEEKQVAELFESIEKKKLKIQHYFDQQGIRQLTVKIKTSNEIAEFTEVEFLVKKTERTYVNYDIAKLEDALGRELFQEATKRKYTITDFGGLVSLLKSKGIKPADFKKFIDVSKSVDKEALKRLYDAKEFTMQDIKDCYTATINKSIDIKKMG